MKTKPSPRRAPATPAPTLAVSILAGGKSSRMGRDKSRVRLGHRSLLTHARATARELGRPIRVIRKDLLPPCGPLSGIYTALASSAVDAELFLACDMPWVSTALLRRLIRSLRRHDRACFASVDRLAGFPFIIRVRCADLVAREIHLGHRSLQELAATLKARRMPVSPRERTALFNVNTPADLATARNVRRDRPTP